MPPKPTHLQMVGARDKGFMSSPDFYATPKEAVEALLKVEKLKNVLEPCCGDGAISKVLEEHKIQVNSSDLYDRGYGRSPMDFAAYEKWSGDLCTNPPYNQALQFVEHAVEIVQGKSCFLLRLQWLAGQKRKRFFKEHPPIRVHVLSKRIPRMHRPDYTGFKFTSTIDFAWFAWESGYTGPTTVDWI